MNCNLSELIDSLDLSSSTANTAQMKEIHSQKAIETTRRIIIQAFQPAISCKNSVESKKEPFLQAAQSLLQTMQAGIRGQCNLIIQLPKRDFRKSCYKELQFPSTSKLESQTIVDFVIVLSLLYEIEINLRQDKVATVRDIYYKNVKLYNKHQTVCQKWIEVLCDGFDAKKFELNIVASQKGLFYYSKTLTLYKHEKGSDKSFLKDFTGSNLIPYCFEHKSELYDLALKDSMVKSAHRPKQKQIIDGVAILEKDAIYSDLVLNSAFIKESNWMLITGKGNTDRLTQAFVKYLREQKAIKIKKFYIFVDSDPYGINIAYNYYNLIKCAAKFEKSSILNGNHGVEIKFKGVQLFDLIDILAEKNWAIEKSKLGTDTRQKISSTAFQLIPLTPRDIRMCQSFLNKIALLKTHQKDEVLCSLKTELQREMFFNSKGEINSVQDNDFANWFEESLQ
ncbi:hypothetical protein ACO0QE_001507 [Hanseniaspora vineae]